MHTSPHRRRSALLIALSVVVIVGGLAAWAWHELLREGPEPAFSSETERFKYGSIGGEAEAGLPYWVWVVLPRIFPEYLPRAGGYASLGLVWEPGRDVPVGFTRKTVGFPRVGNNCAVCHVGTYRARPEDVPTLVIGAPAHTVDVQGYFRFLAKSARDPRFNATVILDQMAREVELSWVDRQLYRQLIIPLTRRALVEQTRKLEWMDRPGVPAWGPGRDDAFNLPKYVVAELPLDNSVGQCDFGSAWNLQIRKGPGVSLNQAGETPTVRSVIVDSMLGLGARPRADFEQQVARLDRFLSDLPPPSFPFPVDAALAAAGQPLYDRHCAECHAPGRSKTSRVVPIDEIQTDRERLDSWSQAAADAFNRKVAELKIERPAVTKRDGYVSPPLDGLWARAPYLHNGAVPNLRELLEPLERRSRVFFRGYDVYDPVQVGFVSQGPEARRLGWTHDTAVRGDGNQGHLYGTQLTAAEKRALLEFLKTQ